MRVLHVVNSLNRGGLETWLLAMLQQARDGGVQMDVCCRGRGLGELAPLARELGAQVLHCPLHLDQVRFVLGLRGILARGQYDLLHCHTGIYSALPVLVGRQLGVPAVLSFHNMHFQPQNRWTKARGTRALRHWYARYSLGYALRKARAVIAISQGVRAALAAYAPEVPGVTPPRHVIYYGVDAAEPANEAQRQGFRLALGVGSDSPLVLHVGSFRPEKNHAGLLEIFCRVRAQIPQAVLVCCGDGPLRDQIVAQVTDRGLQDAVRLLGVRSDVPRLLALSDVFLLPSLTEGFGLAALEANAAGLPVVASDIPGLAEAVEQGQTALLHPADDVAAMAASVVQLLRDQGQARRLGLAGRRRAGRDFSTSAAARRLFEVYHECTGH